SHPHPSIHPQDQRQGRAVRTDKPARVGLRSPLPQLSATRGRPSAFLAALQLASSARSAQPLAAYQPHPGDEQPLGTQQLEREIWPIAAWRVVLSLYDPDHRKTVDRDPTASGRLPPVVT